MNPHDGSESGELKQGKQEDAPILPAAAPEETPASGDLFIAKLAQSFMERCRLGERPSVEEYAARHPELAEEIREFFPMLGMLEKLGPSAREAAAGGAELQPLQRLGDYRIIREIGRGGMGVVYEAEQESLGRRVALKILPFQAFQDSRQLERFRMEAQAAARLHHANIVPVFGVGEDRGIHFYVMQFIRGQTLAEVLAEVRRLREAAAPGEAKPSPSRDSDEDTTAPITRDSGAVYYRSAARLCLQVADALAYAHGEGILHRDIKPSNLLVDLRGTVWITDFGLAKLQDSGELTATGSLMGTLRYMAPERLQGKGDARSDLYGLGITLYEMLALRPAYLETDRAQVLKELATRDPAPPRRLDPDIPRDLETIVMKAISRDPRDRYQSMQALADDLRRFLHYQPLAARRAAATERFRRWCQRNPAVATLSGLSAMLLIALAAGALYSAVQLRLERDRTIEKLATAKLEEGRAWRLGQENGRRSRSIAALREAAGLKMPLQVRNQLIGSLAIFDLEEVSSRPAPSIFFCAGVNTDSMAIGYPDGSMRIFGDIDGGTEVAVLPGNGRQAMHLYFSPDGRYLAEIDQDSANLVWDIAGKNLLLQLETRGYMVLAFDPAGKFLVEVAASRDLILRSLPQGEEMRRFKADLPRPGHLEIDSGGRRLAVGGCGFNGQAVQVLDLESGASLARLQHPDTVQKVSWHPEGRMLAVGCNDHKIHLWETESWERIRTLEGHSAEVTRLAFDHAGEILASAGWDGRTLFWSSRSGEILAEAWGSFTAFSADDTRVGFDLGRLRLGTWKIQRSEVYRLLYAHSPGKGPFRMDISPDGSWLAVGCLDEGASIWSLDGSTSPGRIGGGMIYSVQFEADGSALWTGGSLGLNRWPLRQSGAGAWTIGPPSNFYNGVCGSMAVSMDRKLAALIPDYAYSNKILICDLEASGTVSRELRIGNVKSVVFSPMGRWIAGCCWQAPDLRIWNTADFTLAHVFKAGTSNACFSPDERHVAVSEGGRLAVYRTADWELEFQIEREKADGVPGPVVYSVDGRSIAWTHSRSLAVLLQAQDGKELARFEPPSRNLNISDMSLSANNVHLVAVSGSDAVQVWNLARLRRELAGFGLDWSPGEKYPESGGPAPRRLSIDGGDPGGMAAPPSGLERNRQLLDLISRRIEIDGSPKALLERAEIFTRLGDNQSALADLSRAEAASPGHLGLFSLRQVIRLKDLEHRAVREEFAGLARFQEAARLWKEILDADPENLMALDRLAWLWALDAAAPGKPAGPDDLPEGAGEALERAAKCHAAEPGNFTFLRTLGMLQYHTGHLKEARASLEKAWNASRLSFSAAFYLSMVEARLGNPQAAARRFDEADAAGQGRRKEGVLMQDIHDRLRSLAERTIREAGAR